MESNVAVLDMFAQARTRYQRLERWLASDEAMAVSHFDLEEQLTVNGRELLREMFQAHLQVRRLRERRLAAVEGADGELRGQIEDSERGLMSVFGAVRVPRLSYGARGTSDLHPADAAPRPIAARR